MQPGCSYCSSKVTYHLKNSKRTRVIFSGFYNTLSARHEKGHKKGAKRAQKRVAVNNPNEESLTSQTQLFNFDCASSEREQNWSVSVNCSCLKLVLTVTLQCWWGSVQFRFWALCSEWTLNLNGIRYVGDWKELYRSLSSAVLPCCLVFLRLGKSEVDLWQLSTWLDLTWSAHVTWSHLSQLKSVESHQY
jgi:hypothetical protein